MGLEDRYQRLKEHSRALYQDHSRALYQDHETRPKTQATPAFRRANTIGWNSTVPWSKSWHTACLIGSRQPVRMKAAQRLGLLSPLLLNRSGVSIKKWRTALQAAHPSHDGLRMPDLAVRCPHAHYYKCCDLSVFALRLTHPGTLVRSKSTRIWRLFFADHIRALIESLGSKLADAGNPLVRQLGRHLCQPRADWSHPRVTEEGWRSASQSRLSL
jgi:hypothetical protein